MPESRDGTGRAGRDASGRFLPETSGNPGGRPKGFAALVREKTRNGESLVDFAVRVHEGLEVKADDDASIKDKVAVASLRLDAGRWLAERGWGAAKQDVELSGPEGKAVSIVIDLGAGK